MPDTFPAGWVGGWVGGWGQVNIKDYLSPAKLELGLSLAIIKVDLSDHFRDPSVSVVITATTATSNSPQYAAY